MRQDTLRLNSLVPVFCYSFIKKSKKELQLNDAICRTNRALFPSYRLWSPSCTICWFQSLGTFGDYCINLQLSAAQHTHMHHWSMIDTDAHWLCVKIMQVDTFLRLTETLVSTPHVMHGVHNVSPVHTGTLMHPSCHNIVRHCILCAYMTALVLGHL